MHYIEQFQQETRELHHHRVFFILTVGISVMLLFTVLDYLLVPGLFFEFFRYRFVVVCFGALLMTINHYDHQQRQAWVIGFSWYLSAGVVFLVMVHHMDAATSPYYVGLLVIITFYTFIAPLTMVQTLVSGFALVALYVLSMLFVDSFTDAQLISLFSNLFFMICFVAIAATQSWADTGARNHECLLRVAESEAAQALSEQAEQLECTVKKRSEEQQVSERRFQLLYEAIADAVILVESQEGRILQANAEFYRRFCWPQKGAACLFYDIVSKGDRERVKTTLLDPVASGEKIADYQITLVAQDNTLYEAEISGAQLQRSGKILGLQLVIRDIGIRKQLEQKLVASLTKVRQTENAAILALAKLSEYRDVNPGKHLERIREYCKIIGDELARRSEFAVLVTPEYQQNLYQGSILHDIGKVAVADTILFKSEPLTKLEEEVLRNHTLTGGDVIKAMEIEAQGNGFLTVAKNIAYFHHEHWDGTGHPYGLQGLDIPLEARIMALVDNYEELTATACEEAQIHQQAVECLVRESGKQFDPVIVETFVVRQGDFDQVRIALAEPDDDTAANRLEL